jgi:hypothetical protein
MNKYIKEKGIILLIESYAESIIKEIFKTLSEIRNDLYFDRKLMIPIKHTKRIIIHIMTNNYCVIIIFRYRQFNVHTTIIEIPSNKNECMEIIKASIEYSISFDNIDKHKITKIILPTNNLYTVLEKYDILLYTIKYQGRTKYFNYRKNYKLYVKKNNLIYNIKKIIPQKFNPIININYHTLGSTKTEDIFTCIVIHNVTLL